MSRMDLLNFEPENDLEIKIVKAKQEGFSVDLLLYEIAESTIYVSSKTEISDNWSGFDPLLLGEDKVPLIAVFSSPSRPQLHSGMAGYVLQIKGRDFFQNIPPGYGVVLNPGFVTQLVVPSDNIWKLV